MAQDYVRYVGEPILAVAAETELQAADAIEAINIDFEPLPHVVDPLDSLFPGGPDARTDGNVAAARIDSSESSNGTQRISSPRATTSCRWAKLRKNGVMATSMRV